MSNAKPSFSLVANSQVSNQAFCLCFVPVFGSLAIIYESNRLGDRLCIKIGWVVLVLSTISAFGGSFGFAWLCQIGLATWLRHRHEATPETPPVKVDLNSCSKHDLVRTLNIPIVYANDIELLRNEGYLFTYAEELTDIAGLPEEQVRAIEPQLIFTYSAQKDNNHTWRQLNFLTASEMEARGLTIVAAERIVKNRSDRGDYRSAIDVKRRTGLAFRDYQTLV